MILLDDKQVEALEARRQAEEQDQLNVRTVLLSLILFRLTFSCITAGTATDLCFFANRTV